MTPLHHPRRIAKTLVNLRVAMTEIDFMPDKRFSYRRSANGTLDSICLSCYLTAATALTPDELKQQELSHLNHCLGNHYVERVISAVHEAAGSL